MLGILFFMRRWQGTNMWRNRKLCETVRRFDSNHWVFSLRRVMVIRLIPMKSILAHSIHSTYVLAHSLRDKHVLYAEDSKLLEIILGVCESPSRSASAAVVTVCYRRTFNRMTAIRWVSSVFLHVVIGMFRVLTSVTLRMSFRCHVRSWKHVSAATLP